VRPRISSPALVAALSLAALTGGCNRAAPPKAAAPAPALESILVASGGEADGRAWDGVVQAVNQASLSAQTSGRVADITRT
jgi:hypothetical protein